VDNQLLNAQCPVVLYLSPTSKTDETRHMPAVHVTANKSCAVNGNGSAEIYKHLMVGVKNVTLTLEEELLMKTLKFFGVSRSEEETESAVDSVFEAQRSSFIASTTTATRYYFGNLKLTLNQVRLSVLRSPKLSPDLQAVRRKLGLSLITFEDANIVLEPFVRPHPFETMNFLTNAVIKHYRDELLSQAVLILGSTDFLGNPIGFLNDLTEGMTGLVTDGNVGGLIKNLAHGAANSTAKVSFQKMDVQIQIYRNVALILC
jgi:vacuolar protein sorting-associated protein 13D